jgi:nuclear RNA export factor
MISLWFFFHIKDGADLPPLTPFHVNEDFNMPTNKGNYLSVEEGMTVVCRFLRQYYQLYDSNNREELVNAYHDNAVFSITSTYPQDQNSK